MGLPLTPCFVFLLLLVLLLPLLLLFLCHLMSHPSLSPQNGLLFGLPIVLDTNSEEIFPGEHQQPPVSCLPAHHHHHCVATHIQQTATPSPSCRLAPGHTLASFC